MKKMLILTALLVGISAVSTAFAQPPEPAPMARPQAFHEQMLFKPDFTDMLLQNKELNLTEKQKAALKKESKRTVNKVRKLDKKIRDAREERVYLVGDHFRAIQEILTDEQKDTLYNQHKQQIEARMAEIQKRAEMQKCKCGNDCKCTPVCKCNEKNCKCGEKCKCTTNCKCNEKKPCPVKSKCKQQAAKKK